MKTKLGVWTVGVKDTAETDSERGVLPDPVAAVCVRGKTPQYRDY